MNIDELLLKINTRLEELDNKPETNINLYEINNNTNPNNNSFSILEEIKTSINRCTNPGEATYQDCCAELDKLVGLSEVKEEIKKLINYLIYMNKVKDVVSTDNVNLNMIFTGNPGTGKTTVAKLVAKILFDLGYLESDKVIETTPRDFIAGYIGQTALKAREVIENYAGGVIFIDEAYSFLPDKDGKSFSQEAIAEIIKEMETKKTVFIFAGYKEEMQNFINYNAGIKSRVGYNIEFHDYSEDELVDIYTNKLRKSKLSIEEDALELVKKIIHERSLEENFGNGRMIDNLHDQIMREHASINLNENNRKKLLTIKKEAILNLT